MFSRIRNLKWMGAAAGLGVAAMLAGCAGHGVFDTRAETTVAAMPREGEAVPMLAVRHGVPANGKIEWRLNGASQPDFKGVGTVSFVPHEGETVVEAAIFGGDGQVERTKWRVHGQEFTSSPPEIDGKIGDDWNDPPTVRLDARKQQVRAAAYRGEPGLKAVTRALWTGERFFFGIEVEDSTGRSSVTNSADPLDADSVNLYIAPLLANSGLVEELGIQLRLSPGSDNTPAGVWVDRLGDGNWMPIDGARVAASDTQGGYTLEASIPASAIGVFPEAGNLLAFNLAVHERSPLGEASLIWNEPNLVDTPGYAIMLPDPAKGPKTKRSQLHGGQTMFAISKEATKNPDYLTPLPVEMKEHAAHLPEDIELRLPFNGEYEIATGYGFESTSWTHQTIGNKGSANDFYALDVDMPVGTTIVAAGDGEIIQANRRGDSYGKYVVIDHGQGYHSIYAHLDSLEFDVDKGEPPIRVKAGDVLGKSGATGTSWPHLHFAVHKDARVSHSGANVGGKAVCPEPLGGYYGIRQGHVLSSDN